jgi:hypothetical protein
VIKNQPIIKNEKEKGKIKSNILVAPRSTTSCSKSAIDKQNKKRKKMGKKERN